MIGRWTISAISELYIAGIHSLGLSMAQPSPTLFQQNTIHYSLNGESDVPLPQMHCIVDAEPGSGALLLEMEHHLPEMETQQQLTDNDPPRLNLRQSMGSKNWADN